MGRDWYSNQATRTLDCTASSGWRRLQYRYWDNYSNWFWRAATSRESADCWRNNSQVNDRGQFRPRPLTLDPTRPGEMFNGPACPAIWAKYTHTVLGTYYYYYTTYIKSLISQKKTYIKSFSLFILAMEVINQTFVPLKIQSKSNFVFLKYPLICWTENLCQSLASSYTTHLITLDNCIFFQILQFSWILCCHVVTDVHCRRYCSRDEMGWRRREVAFGCRVSIRFMNDCAKDDNKLGYNSRIQQYAQRDRLLS